MHCGFVSISPALFCLNETRIIHSLFRNYMVTNSFYRDFKQQFAALKLNFETHYWKLCPRLCLASISTVFQSGHFSSSPLSSTVTVL